ncbi:hypothetical protein LOY67_17415 [Pseudomonas sp. B21-056]|jgi:hypothetical protein|uniref:hypothetical protein n=1 Tax=Pseudomonas sp. B21-056 TaxID=2895495 RepID=UPI0022300FFE|nr:hypothetical protein [Pseudomonas sp. B21-056]UZE21825.1 hypothetical protein LOY67_17415 [Pseudomonas sp. B21-056]
MTNRIEKLEAQVNALAQGWLRLAAALEVAGVVAPECIEQALRPVRWPGQSIDAEAARTLVWLCDQLADARSARLTSSAR